jgi:3',5'-cyclic AMP phosphodiesterase CpdA
MSLKIAQFSDIHCGDKRFSDEMINHFIEKINSFSPDIVILAGDLTAEGYEEQFIKAKEYLKKIRCKRVLVIAGNHDFKNVGYEHFKKYYGSTTKKMVIKKRELDDFSQDVKIYAVDSNKPDMGEGEIGRYKYKHIEEFLKDSEKDFTIFVLHHHLISIPGTGLERNDVHDAGDVLKLITDLKVNLVLSGHQHVPHAWELNGTKLISSGTGGTERTRGNIGSSINLIEVTKRTVNLEIYFDKNQKISKKLKRSI